MLPGTTAQKQSTRADGWDLSTAQTVVPAQTDLLQELTTALGEERMVLAKENTRYTDWPVANAVRCFYCAPSCSELWITTEQRCVCARDNSAGNDHRHVLLAVCPSATSSRTERVPVWRWPVDSSDSWSHQQQDRAHADEHLDI